MRAGAFVYAVGLFVNQKLTAWRRCAKKQIVDDEEGICNVNYPITRGIAGFHGAGRRRAKKEIVYQKQSVSDID